MMTLYELKVLYSPDTNALKCGNFSVKRLHFWGNAPDSILDKTYSTPLQTLP